MNEVIGAVLIAVGLLGFYFLVESGKKSKISSPGKMIFLTFVSVFMVIVGYQVITSNVQDLLVRKMKGLLATIIGLFLVVYVPDGEEVQVRSIGHTSILIGLIILILGLYWLMF